MGKKKDLKRFCKLCLSSCGGCSYFDIMEQYCKKKQEQASGTDPACNDYKSWEYGKDKS